MKTRTFHGHFRPTLCGWAVAAAAAFALLGLAACDGDSRTADTETRPAPPRTTNTTRTAKDPSPKGRAEDVWLLQNPDLPTTPRKLFARLKKAAQAGDLGKMIDNLDPVTREMVRLRKKRALESLQKAYEAGTITREKYHEKRDGIESSPLPKRYLEFASVEAEDPVYQNESRCTMVLYRPGPGGTRQTATITLVKEMSLWRLDAQTDMMRLVDLSAETPPTP